MFFIKFKNQLKNIKNNLTQEQIIQKRKELIDEFCDPEDYNLPGWSLSITEKNNKKYHNYITNYDGIKIETIIIEDDNQRLVSYKVNDSLFKEKNFSIKNTINIINVVSLNFLNYIVNCDMNNCNIIFETNNESMAGIDIKLLDMCKDLFPYINYKRGNTNE